MEGNRIPLQHGLSSEAEHNYGEIVLTGDVANHLSRVINTFKNDFGFLPKMYLDYGFKNSQELTIADLKFEEYNPEKRDNNKYETFFNEQIKWKKIVRSNSTLIAFDIEFLPIKNYEQSSKSRFVLCGFSFDLFDNTNFEEYDNNVSVVTMSAFRTVMKTLFPELGGQPFSAITFEHVRKLIDEEGYRYFGTVSYDSFEDIVTDTSMVNDYSNVII